MKNRKLYAIITAVIFSASVSYADSLDSDSATVTLDIGKFAQVTNLDDFSLNLEEGMVDGQANSFYSGTDTYNLESNTGVTVQLSSFDNLSNGTDEVNTNYDIDIGGNGANSASEIGSNMVTFNTTTDQVHNQQHTIGARAQLGEISNQKAGSYSADITMTVSAL
ncbi:hypothetical protein L3V82_09080 [Thiotrichales bacterium 19S3-7]|nr:hypothetical protein [Thiotrichales bacterium 19S3-7]MCF6802312.1 hypothetical protein [Thiotrichales bacterium 19S3-11]